MIKKLDYTRVNALLTQQIEFLNKKIEENQSTIETNQKRYEERLCKIFNELFLNFVYLFDFLFHKIFLENKILILKINKFIQIIINVINYTTTNFIKNYEIILKIIFSQLKK